MEKQANEETKPSPVPRQAAGDDTAISSSSKPDEETDDDKDSDDDEKKKETDTSGSGEWNESDEFMQFYCLDF